MNIHIIQRQEDRTSYLETKGVIRDAGKRRSWWLSRRVKGLGPGVCLLQERYIAVVSQTLVWEEHANFQVIIPFVWAVLKMWFCLVEVHSDIHCNTFIVLQKQTQEKQKKKAQVPFSKWLIQLCWTPSLECHAGFRNDEQTHSLWNRMELKIVSHYVINDTVCIWNAPLPLCWRFYSQPVALLGAVDTVRCGLT